MLKQKEKELVRFFANIKTMWEKCPAVAGQPIKTFKFFRILQSLSWRPPADQRARGLWVRD